MKTPSTPNHPKGFFLGLCHFCKLKTRRNSGKKQIGIKRATVDVHSDHPTQESLKLVQGL